jgi:hypothetical protein
MEFIKHPHLFQMLGMRGAVLPYLYFFVAGRFVKHGDDFTLRGDVSL